MVTGSGLHEICRVCDSKEEFIEAIDQLKSEAISSSDFDLRKQKLEERYSDDRNASQLIKWIYSSPA
jgi:hypothetical protein